MNKSIVVALVAAAAGLGAASAHAGGVSWSISIDTPAVGTVISNVPPYPSVAYAPAYPPAYPVGRPAVVGAAGYAPVPSSYYRPVPAPVYTEPVVVYRPVPVVVAPPVYAPVPVYAPPPAYRGYPKKYARAPIYAAPPPVVVYAGRPGHHRHGHAVAHPHLRDGWHDRGWQNRDWHDRDRHDRGHREHRGWRHD